MQRRLFSRCLVLRQVQMPPMPPIPPKPGGSINMQNAMEMEAERKRKLEQHTRQLFEVVKEDATRLRQNRRAIGIDLGTTNSCICYIDPATKKPKVIPSPTGSWVFPTAITFDKNHELRLYGEEARACVRTSSSATLCSGKRLIGRGFGELGRVQSDMSKTNILSINEKGEVAVEIMGRTYTVVHIIAMFLRYLKNEAEAYLGEEVDLAVVSVPAYFTPQQKVATEDAALAAGFDVLEVIDEPSAACLTYTVLHAGREDESEKQKRIVRSFVFDLGGGTLDCAIMEHDRYRNTFKLVATHGDPMLGGNDWDSVLSEHFATQFQNKWHIPIDEEEGNVGQGVAAYRALQLEAEKAKIHFTHSTEPYHGYNRAFHFSKVLRDIVPLEANLTHEEYVLLTRPLRVRCLECIERMFDHTGLKQEDIDNILLVGAMTRDPPVRHMLEEYFGKYVAREDHCPADYAVAIGAGLRSGMLLGTFPELSSSTRFVSGTVQSLRQSGLLRRAWARLRAAWSPMNPNAIGQRWRGRARGLSDDEIANYAKELVQFEAACHRRQLLERAENDANAVMRRVAADSNRKQGMQEKRIMQLAEQLKFWQYMVHNFHDHEDELLRTVTALQRALDELDGLAKDDASMLTKEGTIDFTKAVHRSVNSALGKPAEDPAATVPAAAAAAKPPAPPGAAPAAAAPKVLRRKVPLPARSTEGQELVAAGHPLLRNVEGVAVTEAARASFLEQQVDERAWREPPVPPGEEGSWLDVKKAVDAGETVGAPLSAAELQRPMTMEEMLETLKRICPIDDAPSEEHARKRDEAIDLQTMTVVEGDVVMGDIQAQLDAEERQSEDRAKSATRQAREEGERLAASMF
ncbi:chaperone protein-like protein [Strigomonas culicis]|uniref:Chaperone protein-like protein n=1 Tax=Strigomonas culicis TaxID=28005 RepID=S9U377_9TRYP|nr:chaperone protein-like protein [Strigomonas culicis]|eukprot:EPY23244.1 chaperone protein-like protein [Strigomonas culicis]